MAPSPSTRLWPPWHIRPCAFGLAEGSPFLYIFYFGVLACWFQNIYGLMSSGHAEAIDAINPFEWICHFAWSAWVWETLCCIHEAFLVYTAIEWHASLRPFRGPYLPGTSNTVYGKRMEQECFSAWGTVRCLDWPGPVRGRDGFYQVAIEHVDWH